MFLFIFKYRDKKYLGLTDIYIKKPLALMKYRSKQLEEFISDLSPVYQKELESIIEEKNPKNRSETDKILVKFREDKK
jgi:hypothetical protein